MSAPVSGPRRILGQGPGFDAARLTQQRTSELIEVLRNGREALERAPGRAETVYEMWEALEQLGRWGEAASALKTELRISGYGAAAAGETLALDEVALVAVDCADPALSYGAMELSLSRCRFAEAVLFTDRSLGAPRARVEPIAAVDSESAYSEFIMKSLAHRVRAEHVLIVQWDGFVLDADRWSDEFLLYDYIGAPWPHFADGHNVGNGGFSLRSRRLLLALQDPALAPAHPEDRAICRTYRRYLEDRHGIAFAPEEAARAFSFELDVTDRATFGFHGMFHLPAVLADCASLATFRFLDPLIERWQTDWRLRP